MTATQKSKSSVYIIGAGIGGLTTAALLMKKGYPVRLFEREAKVGGRAMSYFPAELSPLTLKKLLARFKITIPFSQPDLTGLFRNEIFLKTRLDLGFHMLGGGYHSNGNRVLSSLTTPVQFSESFLGVFDENRIVYPFLKSKDRLRLVPYILRLLAAGENHFRKRDDVPVSQIYNVNKNVSLKKSLQVFARLIATVNDLDVISVGEILRAQKNSYKAKKPVGYPPAGLAVLSLRLKEYIEKMGGEVLLCTHVDRLDIRSGKVAGVRAKGRYYPAKRVVSNIPVHDIHKLISGTCKEKQYFYDLEKIQPTASLCAYYFFSAVNPVTTGKSFHFLQREPALQGGYCSGMIDFRMQSPVSPINSSKGYLVQAYCIGSPEEIKNKNALYKLKCILDNQVSLLVPHFPERLIWCFYPAVHHLDGVAKTIHNLKPGIKTPVEGLYLTGDGVKAAGIGVNCAVNSAIDLVRRCF